MEYDWNKLRYRLAEECQIQPCIKCKFTQSEMSDEYNITRKLTVNYCKRHKELDDLVPDKEQTRIIYWFLTLIDKFGLRRLVHFSESVHDTSPI